MNTPTKLRRKARNILHKNQIVQEIWYLAGRYPNYPIISGCAPQGCSVWLRVGGWVRSLERSWTAGSGL